MTGWRAAAYALLLVAGNASASGRVLDDFSQASAWRAEGTDDIETHLRAVDGPQGKGICLDFDFHGVSGAAMLKRELPINWPSNFTMSFDVRGTMSPNDLQVKFADDSGDNVWWYRHDALAPTDAWTGLSFRRSQVDFAWGPTQDRSLRRTQNLEFTIYAGQGGKGEVCFANLRMESLPAEPASWPVPRAKATSELKGHTAQRLLDGKGDWRSVPSADTTQDLTLDLRSERDFGGLQLRWLAGQQASHYQVALSDDGEQWRDISETRAGNGGDDAVFLPEARARYLRLRMLAGPSRSYGLTQLQVMDRAWGASPNVFFQAQAKRAPRGMYPRGFSGEQSYWTLVGVDGGAAQSALLSEDGAVEVGKGGWSIEPMILADRNLLTWASVRSAQSLMDGYLPIPSVQWQANGLSLDTTVAATGGPGRTELLLRYTINNTSGHSRRLTLALLARPFQVNPPTQFLNTPGGIHRIHDLAWRNGSLIVNGKDRVVPLQATDDFVASDFSEGDLPERLAHGQRPSVDALHSDEGFAQGALLYRMDVPAHGSRTIGLVVPMHDGDIALPRDPMAWLQQQIDEVAQSWRGKLNRVELQVPANQQSIVDTARSALAQMLMSRDGPALQPGTRSYARAWIRDGAMMTEGLVRSGHADVASQFVEWYAPHQFTNGKVPCCVDARGSDPVPENDSHGELIFAIAELWRYTHDRAQLERLWPHVQRAIVYMDQLRASESTAANQTTERRSLYGLMPASISHEGYSAKPMHSYWDDFWALKGYDDAVDLAGVLGHADEMSRIARERDRFRANLMASISASVSSHGIDYLPGAAELGDFDATSTTIALSPGNGDWLPRPLVDATFERYWKDFVARRDGQRTWDDYTPYELRTVATFVRLGWRERVQPLVDFFFADRRPAAWNQWAEVVGREPRKPRFVGDMPHAWIASDYLRSAYDLFAYERARDKALVLAAGIPATWLAGGGIGVEHLRTPYGELTYRLREERGRLVLQIGPGLKLPPGGVVLPWPYAGTPPTVAPPGARWEGGDLVIRKVPVTMSIELSKRH